MPPPFAFFDPEIPPAGTNEALDEIAARFPNYDRYYLRCAAEDAVRQRMTEWWNEFAPYADADFRHQYRLPEHFHARTWEMYLGVLLLRRGHELVKPNAGSPDVHVLHPKEFWIEAIAPSPGVGANALQAEIDPPGKIVVRDFPEDGLLLRFCSAMSAKRKQNQRQRRDGTVAGDLPYVVAVNTGALNLPDREPPLATRAAFGIGPLAIPLGNPREEPYYVARETVLNANGIPVPIGLFRSPDYSPISAVLVCRDNVLTLTTPGRIVQSVDVVHNPLADVPIADDIFAFATQWRLDDGDTVRKIRPR